jgi:hypothetical protein
MALIDSFLYPTQRREALSKNLTDKGKNCLKRHISLGE